MWYRAIMGGFTVRLTNIDQRSPRAANRTRSGKLAATLEVGRMVVPDDPMALAIDVQQLWKSYDGKPALQGLSLDAREGEIFGLIGPNGAGKTTTLKILVGLLRPDIGVVRVKGNDVLADPVSYKADIGYMPEAPTLPEYLTPGEFLGYVGRIRNLPRDRIASRTNELLAMLDLTGKADDTIASLSKGMKAKLAFAAAIIHEPSILILDEPLIGIDPAGQHLLKERLMGIARAGGTVLVSTHQLDTAERLCDRVAIVNHGRNVATGSLESLRASVDTGEHASLEEIFLRLTQEATAPEAEAPRRRGLFRRG